MTAIDAGRADVHDEWWWPTAELRARREEAARGPSEAATRAQRAKGKLLARERIDLLLDKGTFTEIESGRRHRANGFGLEAKRPLTDGVVTGWGTIEGREVFVYAHDFRMFGGALGEAHAAKIQKVMDLALATGAPIIGLNDGAGARIQEGVLALTGYGGIFRRITRASGIIPQISVMLGPCAGGAAYAPALTDFIFMVRETSNMFITGPDVVETVTGERVTSEQLGGADLHTAVSGVAHFAFDDEVDCLEHVRYLVSILPENAHSGAPVFATQDPVDRPCDSLAKLVPVSGSKPYDVREVIGEIVDDGEFLEVHQAWGTSLVCALGHLGGHLTGILANQPAVLAGALNISSSEKGARFVHFCDSFSIPLVTLVDVPGFLPGADQERGGIIRHGAKLLYAYCNATVPRVTLIMRKAYGGAYIVMNSQSIGADITFAWPTNEVAVMGAESAAGLIFAKEIAAAEQPAAKRQGLIEQYRSELMHPFYAAERGLVDEVIDPAETRHALIDALRMLSQKVTDPARKHGNPPQ